MNLGHYIHADYLKALDAVLAKAGSDSIWSRLVVEAHATERAVVHASFPSSGSHRSGHQLAEIAVASRTTHESSLSDGKTNEW